MATWWFVAGWCATTMIDQKGRDQGPAPFRSRAWGRCGGSACSPRWCRGALPDLVEQGHRGIDAVPHRFCGVADHTEPCFAAAQEEACAASPFMDAAVVVVAATLGAVLPTVAPPVLVIVTVTVASLSLCHRSRQG